jgi:hypothetical protein
VDWAGELRQLRGLSDYQKIEAINNLVNRRTYAEDQRNYGTSDYWASPREFLTRSGDCEDFALLKYASLMAIGMEDQDLRLVVGRLSDGRPHAFLAAKVGQQEFILDNRQDDVYLTADRKDYVPKYSMNLSTPLRTYTVATLAPALINLAFSRFCTSDNRPSTVFTSTNHTSPCRTTMRSGTPALLGDTHLRVRPPNNTTSSSRYFSTLFSRFAKLQSPMIRVEIMINVSNIPRGNCVLNVYERSKVY